MRYFWIRSAAVVLLFLSVCGSVLAEDIAGSRGGAENPGGAASLTAGFVSRGSARVAFQYPAGCKIVDEGSIGTYVYLTENDYVTLMIPKGKLSGTAAVHDYIGDFGDITELSDSMNVFAVHGDANHRMPFLDVMEIGVNLPDGTGLVVCAYCSYGHTEVYDLLLTVLGSLTDTGALASWLSDVWLPTVTRQT